VVPNVSSERPAEPRNFFVELLGFEVVMDLDWVVAVASPINPSAQVTIVGNDDMAAPGVSVEVDEVDAVHARAVGAGHRLSLRSEESGARRFIFTMGPGGWAQAASCRLPGVVTGGRSGSRSRSTAGWGS
jgi:hypothetical protein